jgi:hypothetical protein
MTAQSTYTLIATYTASGSTNAFSFSTIPSIYTDLVLIGYCRSAQAVTTSGYYVRPNSNTGWSCTQLYGNGSSATGARYALNTGDCQVGIIVGNSATAGIFSSTKTQFFNYSNQTTYKTFITNCASDTNGGGNTSQFVNATNGTAAISSMVIYNDSNSNWAAGSTWALYGILAA